MLLNKKLWNKGIANKWNLFWFLCCYSPAVCRSFVRPWMQYEHNWTTKGMVHRQIDWTADKLQSVSFVLDQNTASAIIYFVTSNLFGNMFFFCFCPTQDKTRFVHMVFVALKIYSISRDLYYQDFMTFSGHVCPVTKLDLHMHDLINMSRCQAWWEL